MIDVSAYQGYVDWDKAYRDGGVRLAGIKLTEGRFEVDPQAKRNLKNARRAGVHVFVYHYGHPSSSPRAEARHFLETARRLDAIRQGDIVPHLDLEVAEGHGLGYLNGWKAAFLAAVDDAIGVEHGTGFYSYKAFLDRMALYPDRPVWGAATSRSFRPPGRWWAHQYSFTGCVPGVRGPVDLSHRLKSPPRVAPAV